MSLQKVRNRLGGSAIQLFLLCYHDSSTMCELSSDQFTDLWVNQSTTTCCKGALPLTPAGMIMNTGRDSWTHKHRSARLIPGYTLMKCVTSKRGIDPTMYMCVCIWEFEIFDNLYLLHHIKMITFFYFIFLAKTRQSWQWTWSPCYLAAVCLLVFMSAELPMESWRSLWKFCLYLYCFHIYLRLMYMSWGLKLNNVSAACCQTKGAVFGVIFSQFHVSFNIFILNSRLNICERK